MLTKKTMVEDQEAFKNTKVQNKLGYYITKKQMPMKEFALRMGVTYNTVNNWVSQRIQPSLEVVGKASIILEVPPKKLLSFSGCYKEI